MATLAVSVQISFTSPFRSSSVSVIAFFPACAAFQVASAFAFPLLRFYAKASTVYSFVTSSPLRVTVALACVLVTSPFSRLPLLHSISMLWC